MTNTWAVKELKRDEWTQPRGMFSSSRRVRRPDASADIRVFRAGAALDGLVRFRFGDNAELMGAWASARNVLGPFKPKAEPGVGGSQTPKAA